MGENLQFVAVPTSCLLLVLACSSALAQEPTQPLGNAKLADMGILDVTAAPFRADPSGKVDSTKALQAAIDYARDHCMVTFFPPGDYLVSDRLLCQQGLLGRRARVKDPKLLAMRFGIGPRALPNVLVGSRRGERRPRIVLAPNSPGFGETDYKKRKYVVRFLRWNHVNLKRISPNASFNQMFVGIDIVIGPGNPGAVGIRHRAAQGSSVQDCTIDATHGRTGIEGAAGSGGSHINITVIGGRVGADFFVGAQPAPTITGFTLIGQTERALLYKGYETLTAVGLRIVTDTAGPVIVTDPNRLAKDLFGQLSLIDSRIEFRKPGDNVAIDARTSLYMNNVYVKGAATVVKHVVEPNLPGAADGWLHIKEYARGVDPPNKRLVYEYKCPAYVDGRKLDALTLPAVTDVAEPPEDLLSRHVWDDSFPHWELPGAVNVKQPPYSAKGDSQTDDYAAIQAAIDEHEIVFLPRGKYRVSKTLKLRPNTKLIGVHRIFTSIVGLAVEGGDFADPKTPKPVVQTADDADARTVVANLGISSGVAGAYCLSWRAGRHSIYRAVESWVSRPRKVTDDMALLDHPQTVVSGNGGGRWYNFHADHRGTPRPNYRHLLIQGTAEPLAFYQNNPEHSGGKINMEICGAKNVSIYGLKGESPTPILLVRDSDHIHLFGYGGNAIPPKGESLVVVERTPNFLIANLVDRPMGVRGDPTSWHALIETTPDGRTIKLPPLERPVLYKRGRPVRR